MPSPITSMVDWMARGLPMERRRADEKRAIDFAGPPVLTCVLQDPVGPLRTGSWSAYGVALVLAGEGACWAGCARGALERDPRAIAQDVMAPGSSTHRPNLEPSKLLEKLQQNDFKTAILGDPDGHLLGVLRRQDLPEPGEE